MYSRRSPVGADTPFVSAFTRIYTPGQLQFITSSTYRRAALFFSDRFCRCFVQRLEEVRQEWHFLLIGWVLMPEHFHLLIKPEPADTTPLILKGLKEESANAVWQLVATARVRCRGPFRPRNGKSPRHRRHAVATRSCAIIPPQLTRGLALRERPTDRTALSVATRLNDAVPDPQLSMYLHQQHPGIQNGFQE